MAAKDIPRGRANASRHPCLGLPTLETILGFRRVVKSLRPRFCAEKRELETVENERVGDEVEEES